MKKRLISIALPSTGEEEWLATKECFETGWLTQGPKVAAFEKAFAIRHEITHAFAVTSCTTGLHLALAALGVGPGDEVIVPAFTWVATANAVLYCGATPVFVDVDYRSHNIDPSLIQAKVSKKTKAVIIVHLFGLCADIDAIRDAIGPHISIIEDAACAAGAAYKNRSAGSLGDIGVFSFHPRKSITTGEGGMITTNNSSFADSIDQMRNHGASISEEQRHLGPKPYLLPEFHLLGYNYRMTDFQGAIGLVQLKKLDRFIQERDNWASFYRKAFANIDWLTQPIEPKDCLHAWQSYVCTINPEIAPFSRNEIMEKLNQKGVSTRPGTHAVPMLSYYHKQFGYKPEDFPSARDCELHTISLPLHNRMTESDYQYVVESIIEISKER